MTERKQWILAAIALLLSCIEPPFVGSLAAAGGSEQDQNLLTTPDSVMDGTNFLELRQLRRTPLPPDPAGTYRAEQGGAELFLSIVGESGSKWAVTRTYEEPGLEAQVMRYQAERSGRALVSSGGNLAIQGTEEGILVLELDSETDAIPPDYWVHYLKVQ